jgi:uncharacterized protein YecE (DUF72 family)
MKFGRVSAEELDQLELSLPSDHKSIRELSGKKSKAPKVYIGCAKWGRKEWLGLLYPEGTSEKDFLNNYVNHFNAIELNGTFYGTKKAHIEKWAESGVKGFKFCPKFTQIISHRKRLKEAEQITEYYLDAINAFGDYFGKAFLQLPENFGPKNFDIFKSYIQSLPGDAPVTVELRHKGWFEDKTIFDETVSMLRENNKGIVITDVAGRRDALHMAITTPYTFIRFNGYDLHQSDYSRMDEWALRLKSWLESGLEEIYFFLHQEDERHTPETSSYFTGKINEVCNLDLRLPNFLNQ